MKLSNIDGNFATAVDQSEQSCYDDFEAVSIFPRRIPFRRRGFTFLLLATAMVSFLSLLWSLFRHVLPDGGIIFGDEEQNTSSPAAIVSQCEIFMRENLRTGTAYGYNYSFNQPSSFKYSPSQWLWGEKSSAFLHPVFLLGRSFLLPINSQTISH